MARIYARLQTALHADTAEAVLSAIDAYTATRTPIHAHEVSGIAGGKCKSAWIRNAHSETIRRFALAIPDRHFQPLLEKYNFEYRDVCRAIMRDEFR